MDRRLLLCWGFKSDRDLSINRKVVALQAHWIKQNAFNGEVPAIHYLGNYTTAAQCTPGLLYRGKENNVSVFVEMSPTGFCAGLL